MPSLRNFFFVFFCFFSLPDVCFIISSSVSNRNSTLLSQHYMGLNKEREKKKTTKRMNHRGLPRLLPRIVLSFSRFHSSSPSLHTRSLSLSLSRSLYITFQPSSLTLSVSRNKETCESKHTTTTTVVKHNRNFSTCLLSFVTRHRHEKQCLKKRQFRYLFLSNLDHA